MIGSQPGICDACAFRPDVTLPALWTDRPDWQNHLLALAATGHINQADADQLAHFADHGQGNRVKKATVGSALRGSRHPIRRLCAWS